METAIFRAFSRDENLIIVIEIDQSLRARNIGMCHSICKYFELTVKMATLRTVHVVLVGISVLLLAFCSENGLASKTPPKTFLFSDKTPYHFTIKPIEKPPKCEPVHINMVIRHGSRYPGSHRVGKMEALLKKINRFFPSNSTFRYKSLSLPWHIPSDILNSASKEMSALGLEEMYSIAKRFRARFHGVLKHGYSNTNYSFVATDKLRSSQSAIAFAQGLFEGEGHLGPAKLRPVAVKFSGSYDDDKVLRIFEACPKWQKLTAKRNSQYRKFMNGPEMRKVLRKISKRLQLAEKLTLRPEVALEMFLMCAFGVQTDSADSSWCAVFEDADFKVLEYLSDLKLYWERSYGRKINYKMACPLYAEITDSFESFFKQGKPHGIFRFAHTGTVIPLLTMLGLYNDSVPPRADNFDQQGNRAFRVSDVVPMSGNVAFVLYKCKRDSAKNESNGDIEEKSDCSGKCQHSKSGSTEGNPIDGTLHVAEVKIQLLVNEAAVPMPACGGKMYCSVQRFLSYYSHIKTNCDIKTICGTPRQCKKANKGPQD